jgi:hypothetical protein
MLCRRDNICVMRKLRCQWAQLYGSGQCFNIISIHQRKISVSHLLFQSGMHNCSQTSTHIQDQIDNSSTKKPWTRSFFCRRKNQAPSLILVSSFGVGVDRRKTF